MSAEWSLYCTTLRSQVIRESGATYRELLTIKLREELRREYLPSYRDHLYSPRAMFIFDCEAFRAVKSQHRCFRLSHVG